MENVPRARLPGRAALQVLSTVFLRMIKSLVAPLLFATLVVGIAGHGADMKRIGRLVIEHMVPQSIFEAAAGNEFLQITFFAILFAVALSRVQGPPRTCCSDSARA